MKTDAPKRSEVTRRTPFPRRVAAVLVGYVAACLMAGFVLLVVAGMPSEIQLSQFDVSGNLVASSLFVVGLLSVFVAALAAVPALVGIVLGEVLVIRSLFYYVLGGGLIAGLGYYFAAGAGIVPLTDIEQRTSETMLLTAAGLVAGFSYWAVAGRRAGATRHFWD